MPLDNETAEGNNPEPNAYPSKRWKAHLYRVGSHQEAFDDLEAGADEDVRKKIEPWLSAVFQSDYLSLLLGSGFTRGIATAAGTEASSMGDGKFDGDFGELIAKAAEEIARRSERGEANFEDHLRAAHELLRGLEIQGAGTAADLRDKISGKLTTFLEGILETERLLCEPLGKYPEVTPSPCDLLVSFMLSFASRAASRERLNLFTTNYDRLIEYGCDLAGLHVIDRFVGALMPIFRAGRLNLDLHYNPPGIRGEPRYMEGVVRMFKLHGSLDWRQEGKQIRRYGIPFGAPPNHSDIPREMVDSVMIYPNAAKDMETSEYPYAELFRDFAAAICRPNSALVTYGYGFGDEHINRVIRDMLTIPSTHLVIISYDDPGGRIERFCNGAGHEPQVSLLIGRHFGNLPDLVRDYLPKAGIDLISARRTELLRRREGDLLQQDRNRLGTEQVRQEGVSDDITG